jgi:hypothetical protein
LLVVWKALSAVVKLKINLMLQLRVLKVRVLVLQERAVDLLSVNPQQLPSAPAASLLPKVAV